MTKRTKTGHETDAIQARTATNDDTAMVGHGCNCGDQGHCNDCTARIDAVGRQVARYAVQTHIQQCACDDLLGRVCALGDKVNYYAWATVIGCVIALASLWVALAR